MNTINDKNMEQMLEKTLELLDGGKSQEEVLSLFPEHQEMLKEIFSTIILLEKEKTATVPPRELLKAILKNLPQGVTKMADSRYFYRGEEMQGRPSISNLITKIHYAMTSKWKIATTIGVIAVVALLVGYSRPNTKGPRYVTEKVPAASSNVDDVVTAFLQESSGEALVFQNETGDADLIAADSQVISDIGQSYNENEF